MPSRCPEVEVLKRLMLGQLPQPEADTLAEHVLQCARCAETVHSVEAEDPLVEAARAAATGPEDESDSGLIQSLIERLRGLPPPGTPDPGSAGQQRTADEPTPAKTTAGWYDLLAPPQGPGELGRLGPYRVLKILGAGGMGIVFLAEDPQLLRPVALKVIRPEPAVSEPTRQRFLREAQATAALEHDHIVTVYQVGEDHGVPFLAMQLLRGETLDDRLGRLGERLPLAEVLRITREVAEGLAAAHERGLIHRDIKPANLWLENGSGRVKILDFGLARLAEEPGHLTRTGVITGTPQYMAPEQAGDGPLDLRCDLFSLGCVLYRMTTGTLPFVGATTTAVLRSLTEDEPQPPRAVNSEVPPALADLTLKLLAKDPKRRPQTARAVLEAITAIEAEAQGHEDTNRPKAHRRATRSRRRVVLLVAASLVLALGAAAYFYGPALYRLATNQGQLVIQINDRHVQVIVKQGGEVITTLDTKTEREVHLKAGTYQIELSEDKDYLGLSPKEFTLERGGQETVRVWVQPVGEIYRLTGRTLAVWSVAFSPDGRQALAADREDKTVVYWDLETQKERGRFEGHTAPVLSVAFSPDGRYALSSSDDKTIRLWNLSDGKQLRCLEGHEHTVWCVAFSPDGRQVISGGWEDKTVRLWDVETGKQLHGFKGHTSLVTGVAFSPDGHRALSASYDQTVRLWDVKTGRELHCFRGHTDVVESVAFSPDGRHALSGSKDKTLRLWDVESGKELRRFDGHQEWVTSVAFSPDGRRVLSGSHDRTVRLWDVATAKELHCFQGHTAPVQSVAFSPGGGRALSGGQVGDGTVRLWQLPLAEKEGKQ